MVCGGLEKPELFVLSSTGWFHGGGVRRIRFGLGLRFRDLELLVSSSASDLRWTCVGVTVLVSSTPAFPVATCVDTAARVAARDAVCFWRISNLAVREGFSEAAGTVVSRFEGAFLSVARGARLSSPTRLGSLVSKISLIGGTFDARANGFWACRKSGQSCPPGVRSITFNSGKDVIISGVKSMNSQITHMTLNGCTNVAVRNVKLVAPGNSPNTDGFHVQFSTGVTFTGSTVQTGDDCVAIGAGTRNFLISKLACGPGHGVSIGSLAKELNEDGVENVTLSSSVFTGTQNGVRIKSWARPSNGFVKNVFFQDLIMENVQNPIIIDQNYCPSHQGCPTEHSGVKISQVTYKNIQGTSATQQAMKLVWSQSNPCTGITLQDIKLTYKKGAPATS
ncbi:hypothetical protein Bca4012_091843 [Brassica carinata]